MKMALKEMDLEATDEQMALILDRVKDMGDKGTRITDTDLQKIAETVLEVINEPKIKLSDLTVVSGKMIMPTASITVPVCYQVMSNSVKPGRKRHTPVTVIMYVVQCTVEHASCQIFCIFNISCTIIYIVEDTCHILFV